MAPVCLVVVLALKVIYIELLVLVAVWLFRNSWTVIDFPVPVGQTSKRGV